MGKGKAFQPGRSVWPAMLVAAIAAQIGCLYSRAADVSANQPQPAAAESKFEDRATGDWGGQRSKLKEAGVDITLEAVLEGFDNFRGGISTSKTVGAATLDAGLMLDTEKLLKWPGGTFYADLEYHGGGNPTEELVGDLQVFDKQNQPHYLQLFELWYQQKLLDDKVRVKIGKTDVNTEFDVIDYGLGFLHSSSQLSPTNFLLPTTPDPMPGIAAFLEPCDTWYAGVGAYYANRSVDFGNWVGTPQDAQLSTGGVYLVQETGFKWKQAALFERAGNFKLGAWEHTGEFKEFDGNTRDGTAGAYAIFDQTLWQPADANDDGPGIRSFLEWGRTAKDIQPMYRHLGGGITWTGLLPSRPSDVLGFTAQYVQLSGQADLPQPYELAYELTYQLQLTPWATLQPDLQYIANPGGQFPDALVMTVRLDLKF